MCTHTLVCVLYTVTVRRTFENVLRRTFENARTGSSISERRFSQSARRCSASIRFLARCSVGGREERAGEAEKAKESCEGRGVRLLGQ